MSDDPNRKVGARCRTCGRQLTVVEFRACTGLGHFCADHIPLGTPVSPRPHRPAERSSPRPRGRAGGGRHRRVTDSGEVEYFCKAQFARTGSIRRGRLTCAHPSCIAGQAVFVCDGVGYGPREIAILFIRDAEGRSLAERQGFTCHD